jgi:hypothetical protein
MGDVTVASGRGAAALYESGVFAFVRGSDDNLWSCFTIGRSGFQWANLGGPIAEVFGVVCLGPAMFVFCLGQDGQLLVRWWDGQAWHEGALGLSPSGKIERGVGVTSNGSMIYVFVEANCELCMCWWSGSQWQWHQHGRPAQDRLVVYDGGAIASDSYVWAFVTDQEGVLWARMWNGFAWQWSNLAAPPGTRVNGPPIGCTFFNNHPIAYVHADDDHLWSCAWNGLAWFWTDLGTPGGSGGVCGRVGVVSYHGWPQVFVTTRFDEMWVNSGNWQWAKRGDVGSTEGVGATSLINYHHHDVGEDIGRIIGGAILATASLLAREERVDAGTGNKGISGGVDLMVRGIAGAQKSGTTEEFPFAFARGSDGNLVTSWYYVTGWQWSDLGRPESSPGT